MQSAGDIEHGPHRRKPLKELRIEGVEQGQAFVGRGVGGHQAAQQGAHGCVVSGGAVVGPAYRGVDGRLQLAERVVVVQIAAQVNGGALVQLILGGFDSLFEGAAFRKFGSGDGACQARMYEAILAGCQKRRPAPDPIGHRAAAGRNSLSLWKLDCWQQVERSYPPRR